MSDGDNYPSRAQLRDVKPGLLYFIEKQAGGHKAFAVELGLSRANCRGWTVERACDWILKLSDGVNYPTPAQRQSVSGLDDYIEGRLGRHQAFASGLGLLSAKQRRSQSRQAIW